MSWDKEGQRVVGRYINTLLVSGTVVESRVKYGGSVCHTVSLDEPVTVFGAERKMVLLDETELLTS